jgi:hypothetical protein
MKKSLVLLKAGLLCLLTAGVMSCEKDEPVQLHALQDVKWKLMGFVDAQGYKQAEPYSNDCYWLIFNANNTLHGKSSTNSLAGRYEIKTDKLHITNLIGTAIGEIGDGELFTECLQQIESFELSDNELKLYYNGGTNYLLFLSSGPRECGSVNISDNEYVSMQPAWEEYINLPPSQVRLRIENHTQSTLTLGYFSLDYFDGTYWTPVNWCVMSEDIGLPPVPAGESWTQTLNVWPDSEEINCRYEKGLYRISRTMRVREKQYTVCTEVTRD